MYVITLINNALVMSDMELKFSVNDYIENIVAYEKLKVDALSADNGIQKLSFLLL